MQTAKNLQFSKIIVSARIGGERLRQCRQARRGSILDDFVRTSVMDDPKRILH